MSGIALADKIALNEALIRSGADITQINAIRQRFSRLKGGRLAQIASGVPCAGRPRTVPMPKILMPFPTRARMC